jgi:excinuclease ABC subunit C
MLGEVLTRRLQHLATGWPRPDLILIDGGASQLHLAQKVLRPLNLTIPVVSLAKKEEVIFTTKNRRPIKLATRDSIRILLQQLRDEAHRFAVSYHTHLHRHKSVHSRLDQIPGLGPRTIKKLRQKFGTLSALRQATPEAIAAVVGPARARAIFDQLF